MTKKSVNFNGTKSVLARYITATPFQISAIDSQLTPSARFRHASCFSEPYIYIHGGRSGIRALRDLWRLNIHNCAWEKLEPRGNGELPGIQEEHFFVKYGNNVYLVGNGNGLNNLCQIEMWMLNVGSITWTKLSADERCNTPLARSGATGNILDSKLYIFGGFVLLHQRPTNSLLEFDFESSSWRTICPHEQDTSSAPPPLYSHSSIIYEKELYIFGGTTGHRSYSTLWKFCLRNKFWLAVMGTKGRSPSARYGHSAVQVASSMWIYGGQNPQNIFGDLWSYNLNSKTWTEFQVTGSPPMPPLSQHTVIVYKLESESRNVPGSTAAPTRPLPAPVPDLDATIHDGRCYMRTTSEEPLIVKSKVSDKTRYQYDNDAIELTDINHSYWAIPKVKVYDKLSSCSEDSTIDFPLDSATSHCNKVSVLLIGGNTTSTNGLPKPLSVYTLQLNVPQSENNFY